MPFSLYEPHPAYPQKVGFGRGGAGNRASARPAPPSIIIPTSASQYHDSKPKTFTTGRGGAGNAHDTTEERVMFRFDEELAREGKRENVPVYHIGRGGEGNLVHAMKNSNRRPSESQQR